MKSFNVTIKNSLNWVSSGAISRDFIVFGRDVMEAMVEADDQRQEMIAELHKHDIPAHVIEDVRITSIQEQGEVVGKVSMGHFRGSGLDAESVGEFARKVAERAKRDIA